MLQEGLQQDVRSCLLVVPIGTWLGASPFCQTYALVPEARALKGLNDCLWKTHFPRQP